MIHSTSKSAELNNASNEELILCLVGMGIGNRMYAYEYKQMSRIAKILHKRGVVSDVQDFEMNYWKRTNV